MRRYALGKEYDCSARPIYPPATHELDAAPGRQNHWRCATPTRTALPLAGAGSAMEHDRSAVPSAGPELAPLIDDAGVKVTRVGEGDHDVAGGDVGIRGQPRPGMLDPARASPPRSGPHGHRLFRWGVAGGSFRPPRVNSGAARCPGVQLLQFGGGLVGPFAVVSPGPPGSTLQRFRMHAQLLGHMPHHRLRISVAVALAAGLVLLAWSARPWRSRPWPRACPGVAYPTTHLVTGLILVAVSQLLLTAVAPYSPLVQLLPGSSSPG
jgi:hypothetical protein